MHLLKKAKPTIQKLLNILSTSLNLESAIIDDEFNLIISTKNYLKYKGIEVHSPSIKKVLSNGRTLVNKPGHMRECNGCRFDNKCPSTIEILNTIKYKDAPIGVLCLTSFTKEGRMKLTDNINVYIDIINELSDLIESIFVNDYQEMQCNCTNLLLNSVADIPSDTELNDHLNKIKGISSDIQKLKEKVSKIANSSSTVLITGETGTGKELFAKAIHYTGKRVKSPFISINCASIPENLFESELFGYDEGAFTGAKKGGKPGRFELAQGGTIFLDEIGEMPLYTQAKLLRVLQDHTIYRVGGIRPINIDVRVIAATNQNLEDMIAKKEFRADLYYRVNVIPLNIPPLRYRKNDIELLSIHFLEKYNKILDKNIKGLSSKTLNLLKAYDWPGNVRELENIIEYAVNVETNNIIDPSSLTEKIIKNPNTNNLNIKPKIKNVEFQIIKDTLDKYGWDASGKTLAAKELGIGIRTLYRKVSLYGIEHK